MDSFLKERETVTGEGTRFIVGEPLAPIAGSAGGPGGQRRETPAAIKPVTGAHPAGGKHAAACEPSVKPVVRDGRVTSLVVTCSCGKETEIGLEY